MKKILYILLIIISTNIKSQDLIPPDIPVLDSVSVDLSINKAILGWEFSTASDVKGYVIYRYNNFWTAIDTVNSTTSFYIDNASNPNFHSESYRIAAFDSSYNISPMCEKHSTIYSFPYQKTKDCYYYLNIIWSDYVGWNNLSNYNVYKQKNGGVINIVNQTNDLQYNDYQISDSSSYCYYIRSVSTNGYTSTSNRTCYFTEISGTPLFANADYLTITNYDYAEIKFTIDTTNLRNAYFKVLKSVNDTINFSEIATFQNLTTNKIIVEDDINIYDDHYYYKLQIYNMCDSLVGESNLAQNIILTARTDTALKHVLTWTPYKNWYGTVKEYNVYRFIDTQEPELIATVGGGSTYFSENVDEYLNQLVEGNFCYYVEAVENRNNPYEPFLDTLRISRSNVACATEGPRVFVPTAITPYSLIPKNQTFKPVISFASPKDYTLSIYDRWGQLVWHTNNYLEGWTPKNSKGKVIQEGTYVYVLSFTSAENTFVTKKGNFFVLLDSNRH